MSNQRIKSGNEKKSVRFHINNIMYYAIILKTLAIFQCADQIAGLKAFSSFPYHDVHSCIQHTKLSKWCIPFRKIFFFIVEMPIVEFSIKPTPNKGIVDYINFSESLFHL